MARAVQELKQIPFGHLIGAPMKAAIESQALAAKTTIEFIKEVGFKAPATGAPGDIADDPTTDSDFGDVRNVTFQYFKKNENDEEREFVLTVPILTITPMPYIRIDEMTIDFKAKLTDAITDTNRSSTSVAASVSGSYGSFWTPVKVNFRVSATHNTTSSRTSAQKREYQMEIHVRALQDEMPTGLSRILDILEDAINNAEQSGSTPAPA
jgi:hypothetical protein